jgi:hypothetical protein
VIKDPPIAAKFEFGVTEVRTGAVYIKFEANITDCPATLTPI